MHGPRDLFGRLLRLHGPRDLFVAFYMTFAFRFACTALVTFSLSFRASWALLGHFLPLLGLSWPLLGALGRLFGAQDRPMCVRAVVRVRVRVRVHACVRACLRPKGTCIKNRHPK